MKAIINKQLIKTLTPADKPFEVWDTKVAGFLLRIQPTGTASYYCQYERGKRIKLGLASVLIPDQARDRAIEILAETTKGNDPMAAKKKAKAGDFLSFLNTVYGPWALTEQKDGKSTVTRLKAVFPEFMGLKLQDINTWQVEKWRSNKLKAAKPATVNRDIDPLRACLNKAVAWGLIDKNPMAGIKRKKVDNAITRFLSDAEESALRQALDLRQDGHRQARNSANDWRLVRGLPIMPDLTNETFTDHLKPLVLLVINTGLRRGEALSLKWEDIDFEHDILTVKAQNAKSGKTRHLPLNREAIEVLTKWREQENGTSYVFAKKNGSRFTEVKTAWRQLLKKAGITNFRFHDLRHHFASRLVMAGVDLNTVRELLGHSDYKMTLRYAHLAPEHKREAVSRLVGSSFDGLRKVSIS